MSYFLPHLKSGWHVDQAILNEEQRVVIIRFGHDWDPTCMVVDETLYKVAEKVKNFAVIYLVDITQVPDFNKMYELYDPCTLMFFFRNKHIMIDLGTGNNNKINWAMENGQELIDIIEHCLGEHVMEQCNGNLVHCRSSIKGPGKGEVSSCLRRIIQQSTNIDEWRCRVEMAMCNTRRGEGAGTYIEKGDLPAFKDFPLDPAHPPLAAWSLWGEGDHLGTLNLLTPSRVKEGSKLVQSGEVFPLNWELEKPNPPLFHRHVLKHEQIRTVESPAVFDDVYNNFNTQSSTQWDCVYHFAGHVGPHAAGHAEEIETVPDVCLLLDVPNLPGIAAWAQKGIAGRGVLLDYRRWALKNGIEYSPGSNHEITLENLKKVAEDEGVTLKIGDILLIRSGWIEWYESLSAEEKTAYAASSGTDIQIVGLENTMEMVQWLWDSHFAAVGGDQTVT
ncbi:U4/U6-U5 snRNP complex subunit dib1 [Gonapodya sp. JEL0774]|nr:U4/U6-U5 snRNP complex subunit dib1 [Gonapodya sp. JEL0774]